MRQIIFILLATILLTSSVQAQSEKTGQTAKSVYGELLGNGLVFSANYDMRFKGGRGLGFRAGLGFGASLGITAVTFPVGLNYLVGKGPHYFEIGMGTTYANITLDWFDDNDSGGGWFYFPSVGYRYSQMGKGFQGRIYVGPIIAGGVLFFPWGGISAGYSF